MSNLLQVEFFSLKEVYFCNSFYRIIHIKYTKLPTKKERMHVFELVILAHTARYRCRVLTLSTWKPLTTRCTLQHFFVVNKWKMFFFKSWSIDKMPIVQTLSWNYFCTRDKIFTNWKSIFNSTQMKPDSQKPEIAGIS